uniref:Uncharacterized protein n=1 Tax=Leishmania guyanensis TaxID=5670 RepID=A0A1E1J5H5_LEIGU|nr:hypothetical protein, unknown function [Leishmania guyanensis]
MAHAHTDPKSIDHTLQSTYDELRRGENQHYRSAEARYTNHVKELLGNLERYLETCGVQLPTEVQEGSEITAAAAAASEQAVFVVSSRGRLMGTHRVSQPHCISGRSAPASAAVSYVKCDRDAVSQQEETSNNLSARSSGPVYSGWGNLATPCEARRDSSVANAHLTISSGPVAAATSTLHSTPLQSGQAHAMSDSSFSSLEAAYQRHPTPSKKSVCTANSESRASLLYNSQQATRAHTAYSPSSTFILVTVGADDNAEGNIAPHVYSNDAAGVDSCSVDSASAPIVAIINSRDSGDSGPRSRRRGGSPAMRSPPAPPPTVQDYCTGVGARGSLYASGDGVNRSCRTYPIVSNTIAGVSDADSGAARTTAGHDRWGEFGTFVQSITETRQKRNMAALKRAAATRCPLLDSANGALIADHPIVTRDVERGSSGAASPLFAMVAPSPGVTPKAGFLLPYVLSTGTSMTTPPTPVLAVAAGGQVQPSPLDWCGTKAHAYPLPLQVAHGAGSDAVRALAAAGAAAETAGSPEMADVEIDKLPSPSSGALSFPVPMATAPPQHCVGASDAGVPLAGHRLCPRGGDDIDSVVYYQHTQRGLVPPHPRTSAGAVAAAVLARSPEKEQLMRRLQAVLKHSVSVTSSVQPSALPSAVAAERQLSFSDGAAWGTGKVQGQHSAVGSTRTPVSALLRSPQSPLQIQLMSHYPIPLPSTTKTNNASDGSAITRRSVSSSEHKIGDTRGDVAGGVAWDGSWDFLQLATAAVSGCPHTFSSKDISSEPATYHSVSRRTVQSKDADGDGDSEEDSSGLPRCDHMPKEAYRAHRFVDGSNKTATVTTETPPGGLRAGGGWDMGSCTTARNPSAWTYAKEKIPPSFVATSWMRPPRSPPGVAMQSDSASDGYPPGLTKSDIGNFSRAEEEEALRARRRHSLGRRGGLTGGQQQSQRDVGERQPFSADFTSAHAEKQQLMQRLRMVLSRPGE